MHKTHRLTDSQYMEVEGLLQAMDMPTSHDPEADLEPESTSLCRLSRYNVTNLYEGPAGGGANGAPAGRQRCFTMPHVPPPAPPSTPTLLTSGSNSNSNSNGNCSSTVSVSISPTCSASSHPLESPLNHFIYVKNGKNLRRESRCVDSELSKLFNVVSITNRLTAIKNRSNSISGTGTGTQLAERGILNASRTISKLNGATATKIFKIHRDPKEFLRETDEDSVSAPEYDEEEEDTRFRFFRRARYSRRFSTTRSGRKFARKFARFEHHERMETIVDSFEAAMSFNDADT
ncbi:uncharacterized protein LOC110189198 [Drosophila serrata]|uniref:uncharacterized protein LOC110189198 n=1 Tax=Drosophila serrata TaxID=7274 RepID=UPI000A1D2245|nr:uncharacterized protein LOC110189198 [Drosophila serrata]